eukprot:scaffold54568_cov59-Phaeocystis_antarctica.AAC.2
MCETNARYPSLVLSRERRLPRSLVLMTLAPESPGKCTPRRSTNASACSSGIRTVGAPQHALTNALPVGVGADEDDTVLPAHDERAVLLAVRVAAPVDGAVRPYGLAVAMLQSILPGPCVFDAVGP